MKKNVLFPSFLVLILTLMLVPAAMAGWTKVAPGGQHNLAIDSDGNLWAWGRNEEGQLGDGNYSGGYNRFTPEKIATAADGPWIDIAAGAVHSLALKADGTVWAWGSNFSGQIGNGGRAGHVSPDDYYYPTRQQVLKPDPSDPFTKKIPLTEIKAIASGDSHNLALDISGNVWAWGNCWDGQVGNGSSGSECFTILAVQVISSGNITSIHAGGNSSMAIIGNGRERYAWGSNTDGALGLGAEFPDIVSTPIINGQFSSSSGCHWTDIKIGYYHALGYVACYFPNLSEVEGLYGWGSNRYGQLGLPYDPEFISEYPQVIFPLVANCEGPCTQITQSFTASGNHSHGVFQYPPSANFDLYSWGINNRGEMGNGGYDNSSPYPQHLPEFIYNPYEGVYFKTVWGGGEHVLALDTDGFLWAWGDNRYGQVGNDDIEGDLQPYPDLVLIDSDGDGFPDVWDNCPSVYNLDQADYDGDWIGDVCDNCPKAFNPDQSSTHGNGLGDACDGGTSNPSPSKLTLTQQSGTLITVEFLNGTGGNLNTFPPDCFNTNFKLTDSSGNVLPALDRIGPPYNILNSDTIAAEETRSVTCDLSLMYLPKYLVPGATYAVEAWYSNYIKDLDWVNGECVNDTDGCVDLWQGALHSTGEITIAATNTYTLTYTAGPNGSISGKNTQTVNEGGSGEVVTAVPNLHYIFAGWSDGLQTASRTDSNVTQDLSVTANFKLVYNFNGFFSPVDNHPTPNIAKAGQTIPIKWRLTYLDGSPVSTSSSFSYSAYPAACSGFAPSGNEITDLPTAGSSGLQYLGDGNWQFNWKTDKTYAKQQCYLFKLSLNDGSDPKFADFKFK
jgi:alpha-tubulin suppressor-like RCC1 family protein